MYAYLAAALAVALATPLAPEPSAPADSLADAPPPSTMPVAASPACCVLAKMTPVLLTIEVPVDSDKAEIGAMFAIRLAEPIAVAEGLVIPKGTSGVGEVVHAAKSRAMGKAGELVLAARYLDFNGTRIPLRSFRFGKPQGKDNADTAAVVGIVVSALITPFITGGEVRIPAGADAWARVAADVAFPPPSVPSAAAPLAAAAGQSNTSTQGGEK